MNPNNEKSVRKFLKRLTNQELNKWGKWIHLEETQRYAGPEAIRRFISITKGG